MSQAEVEVVRSVYDLVGDVAALTRDEAAMDRVEVELRNVLSPDVKIALHGPPYSDIRETAWGLDGYRRLWRDWVRPFHSYVIEAQELIDLDERPRADLGQSADRAGQW